MGTQFSHVPTANIQRSTFNRNHGYKTTMDSGVLVPIFVDEALPGDTFSVRLSSLARLATPIVPFMDNIFIDFHFFAVPNRLVWEHWREFMGQQENPADSTDFLVPVVNTPTGGFTVGSVADYFGLPTGVEPLSVNALHFRALNLIWNEWFRDENLQDSVPVPKNDGPDDITNYTLLRRGKRHDYFTSCLPWPQKSQFPVELPLGDSAPIVGFGKTNQVWAGASAPVYETGATGTTTYAGHSAFNNADPNAAFFVEEDPNNTGYPGVYADLSSASAATINSLREAFQLQKMLERDARGGTRYTEIIRSHFSVVSPDSRLQRPEYLGGGSTPVVIQPIAQTQATSETVTPQGNLAAVGSSSQSGVGFTKSFVEHCTIIGLASIRCDLTYQNCVNKMWSRQTKYDFYWPALAHLGEEPVYSRELFAQGEGNGDDAVFGYQERWASYRYKPSQITGKMRSNDPQSLDVWHLSQDFAGVPQLNEEFIQENPPISRVIATPEEPEFIFDGYFRVKTTRPMPIRSVPGLIDHF